MSFKGSIICHDCRWMLTLGKLGWHEPAQFAYFREDQEELGRVILAFIASHIQHHVECMGDTRRWEREDGWDGYYLLTNNAPLRLQERQEPIVIGGVKFWRMPLGQPELASERLRALDRPKWKNDE